MDFEIDTDIEKKLLTIEEDNSTNIEYNFEDKQDLKDYLNEYIDMRLDQAMTIDEDYEI